MLTRVRSTKVISLVRKEEISVTIKLQTARKKGIRCAFSQILAIPLKKQDEILHQVEFTASSRQIMKHQLHLW